MAAAERLGLGRTRFYELYAGYLRAAARRRRTAGLRASPAATTPRIGPLTSNRSSADCFRPSRPRPTVSPPPRSPPPRRPDRPGHRAPLGHRPPAGPSPAGAASARLRPPLAVPEDRRTLAARRHSSPLVSGRCEKLSPPGPARRLLARRHRRHHLPRRGSPGLLRLPVRGLRRAWPAAGTRCRLPPLVLSPAPRRAHTTRGRAPLRRRLATLRPHPAGQGQDRAPAPMLAGPPARTLRRPEAITTPEAAKALVAELRRHRNAPENHREVGRTPDAAAAAARREKRRARRAAPRRAAPMSGACAPGSRSAPTVGCPSASNAFAPARRSAHRSSTASIPTEPAASPPPNPRPANAPCSSSKSVILDAVRLCSHAFLRL